MFSMNRSKGWSYFGITFSLTLILLSCAGKKPPTWGDAENGFILSYRPGNSDIYVYEKTTAGTNTMERSGQSFETTSSSKFIFQLETEKIDSLISFVLTVDTIGYSYESSRGTQAMDFGDIKGKKVRATITPKGARHDIVPIDSLPIPKLDGRSMGSDAKGWLSIRLFQVPGKPIKIGDSWTEAKLDTNTQLSSTTAKRNIQIWVKRRKWDWLACIFKSILNIRLNPGVRCEERTSAPKVRARHLLMPGSLTKKEFSLSITQILFMRALPPFPGR